jgi:hypothetical protein
MNAICAKYIYLACYSAAKNNFCTLQQPGYNNKKALFFMLLQAKSLGLEVWKKLFLVF